jgi:hypothetical protein
MSVREDTSNDKADTPSSVILSSEELLGVTAVPSDIGG